MASAGSYANLHLAPDNHASTPPLRFYRPDALPAAQLTASKHWSLKSSKAVITLVDGVCGTVEVHRQRRYRESSVQHSGEVDWTMQLTAVHSRQQLNPSDTHVRQPLATEHTACHTHTHTHNACTSLTACHCRLVGWSRVFNAPLDII